MRFKSLTKYLAPIFLTTAISCSGETKRETATAEDIRRHINNYPIPSVCKSVEEYAVLENRYKNLDPKKSRVYHDMRINLLMRNSLREEQDISRILKND